MINRSKREAVLALARRGMGPDGAAKQRTAKALVAAGVALPLVAGTAAAQAATALSAAAKGAGASASTAPTALASGALKTAPVLAKTTLSVSSLVGANVGKLVLAVVLAGAGGVGVNAAVEGMQRSDPVVVAVDDGRALALGGASALPPLPSAVAPVPSEPMTDDEPPAAVEEPRALPTPRRASTPVSSRSGAAPEQRAEPVTAKHPPRESTSPAAVVSATAPEPFVPIKVELAGLGAVNAALARGDGAAALRLLAELDAKVPGGSLGPERRVSRVLALCQMGETANARRLAERLLRGGSFYARRLRTSCALGNGAAGGRAVEK